MAFRTSKPLPKPQRWPPTGGTSGRPRPTSQRPMGRSAAPTPSQRLRASARRAARAARPRLHLGFASNKAAVQQKLDATAKNKTLRILIPHKVMHKSKQHHLGLHFLAISAQPQGMAYTVLAPSSATKTVPEPSQAKPRAMTKPSFMAVALPPPNFGTPYTPAPLP